MKKRLLYAVLCLLVPILTFAGDNDSDSLVMSGQKKVAKVQYGTASFYANKFEGRPTANGDVFSQKNLTAASNTLPLNCWVRVTNLRNKKTVLVRINDRMHPKNPRLIDLSRSAAKTLAYTGHGITRVKVEYLGKKKPVETPKVKKKRHK